MEHALDNMPMDETRIAAEQAAGAFAALGSPVRLAILRQLVRAGSAGLPVGALQEALGLPASTLSHHLRALVAAGVLEQTRAGRTLVCRARYGLIEAIAGFLLSECCVDALAACGHADPHAASLCRREAI